MIKAKTPVNAALILQVFSGTLGVKFGGFDLLCGRLEVAGVEALLRSAAEDRGHTQRKLLQADTQR